MQLNASTLNGQPFNGSGGGVAPVYIEGEAHTSLLLGLGGTRTQHGRGDIEGIVLSGDLAPRALRFFVSDAVFPLDAELAQTITRIGKGHAIIQTVGELFFTREVYGSGSAHLGIEAVAYIGAVFIDGTAVIQPMNTEMSIAVGKDMFGTAVMSVQGDLSASAIRQGFSDGYLGIEAVLEPSHIDAGGNRYVGMFGETPVVLLTEDGGMLRQAFLGSLDTEILAAGSGTVRRPTLAGDAPVSIGVAGDFLVKRYGYGNLLIATETDLEGRVFVRGEGTSTLSIGASGTGYVLKRSMVGNTVIGLATEMTLRRVLPMEGSLVLSVDTALTGTRRIALKGNANILLFSSSTGLLNITNEDNESQVFYRPAEVREFIRTNDQTKFSRKP